MSIEEKIITITDFPNEKWKRIDFEVENTNKVAVYISNYGRIKSINTKNFAERIVKGSKQYGYNILKMRIIKILDDSDVDVFKLNGIRNELNTLIEEFKLMRKLNFENDSKAIVRNEYKLKQIEESIKQKEGERLKVHKKVIKKRTLYKGYLIHRLVAMFFVEGNSVDRDIVIHLDYNKMNNHYKNLRWVNVGESIQHQQTNPNVLASRIIAKVNNLSTKNKKLNGAKVMLIKKLLNEGKSMVYISKIFGVSSMQIHRIKTGENWSQIKPAK